MKVFDKPNMSYLELLNEEDRKIYSRPQDPNFCYFLWEPLAPAILRRLESLEKLLREKEAK